MLNWIRTQFVNPLVIEDNTKVVIDSIRRLLEYELFLTVWKTIKRTEGSLPTRVEETGRYVDAGCSP